MRAGLVTSIAVLALAGPLVARTARAQDTTPSQQPAAADPATGPAPAVPVVTTGQTPAPSSDSPTASAPSAPASSKPRPFAGSSLYNQNSMTTGTVFRGQQQAYNPTVESNLFILPRYAINEAFQLRARLVVTYEYTNNDATTYRNEPVLSDTTVQLFYRKIPKVLGFQPAVALNVAAPTSKLSRARTLLFNPGATLQLARPFEHFLGGEAMILTSVAYAHPVYTSRVPEVVDARPPNAFSCVGGTNCQDLLSGTMNPSDTLTYSALFEVEWGHWSPAILYLGASQWAYKPSEAINPVDGTPVEATPGFEPTSVRQTHYVSAWLDYNVSSWFTAELGFWNAVSALGGDGQRSNLVFSRYQDTRVYLGCSIQLDNLVKTLQGGEGGEAGVVRARNERQPLGRF